MIVLAPVLQMESPEQPRSCCQVKLAEKLALHPETVAFKLRASYSIIERQDFLSKQLLYQLRIKEDA